MMTRDALGVIESETTQIRIGQRRLETAMAVTAGIGKVSGAIV